MRPAAVSFCKEHSITLVQLTNLTKTLKREGREAGHLCCGRLRVPGRDGSALYPLAHELTESAEVDSLNQPDMDKEGLPEH